MRAAGIVQKGGEVTLLDLPEPRDLRADEVLIDVRPAGVGNWDDIVRSGGWDVGVVPPMALGVEAAGTVTAVGSAVRDYQIGEGILTHPLPLRYQGAWAERLIAPAELVAALPKTVPWDVAAAFPVPALTAEQVLSEAVGLRDGDSLLVHGAGGPTGSLVVALAALRGADVIATAGPASADRVRRLGARAVFDYRDDTWTDQAREATGGGVLACVNAARGGAATALRAVRSGGRLATITSDPPEPGRDISVTNVYVRPDGNQLAMLVELLATARLFLPVARTFPLEQAGAALAHAVSGGLGGAVVLEVNQA